MKAGLGLSLSEVATRARGGAAPPPSATVIVVEGDSITATTNPVSYARLYLADHAGLSATVRAVSGSGIGTPGAGNPANLEGRQASVLALAPTHLSVLIGANDMHGYATAQAFADALLGYTDAFKAIGTKVAVATVLPRTDRPGWNARRSQVNVLIRAAVGSRIDAVIDFDTCPMGVDGAENDAAKYPDGLHPSPAGQALLRPIYSTVMNGLLGIANEPLDFAFAPQAAAVADQDYDSPAYSVKGLYVGEARPFAVQSGRYARKNGGSWTLDLTGSVVEADTLRVRNHSSASAATQTDVSLTIGVTTATYSVTTAGAGARDWLPTDLPAGLLKAWCRPSGLTGANGAPIDSWTDGSGNALAVTGQGSSSKPTVLANALGSRKAAKFDGPYGSYFALPPGFLTGRTSSATFFVSKNNADPPSAFFAPPIYAWGTGGGGEFYPYVNGSVYSSYCADTRYQTADDVPTLDQWRVAAFQSAPNDWRYYVDATLIYSLSASTFALGSNPLLGAGFDGLLLEWVELTAAPNATQRDRLNGYLHWENGLEAQLPAGHPYKDARPTI